MASVSIHQAKTHLSRLIADALAGKPVTISNGRTGEALVHIISAKPMGGKRHLGLLRGDSCGSDPLAYGFWDPLPDADLALWNGGVEYPDDAPLT